jgi:hypothetical protein
MSSSDSAARFTLAHRLRHGCPSASEVYRLDGEGGALARLSIDGVEFWVRSRMSTITPALNRPRVVRSA